VGSKCACAKLPTPRWDPVTGKRLEETLPQILEHQGVRVDTVTAEDVAKGGNVDIAQSLQTTPCPGSGMC
jgi:hypothetical protein